LLPAEWVKLSRANTLAEHYCCDVAPWLSAGDKVKPRFLIGQDSVTLSFAFLQRDFWCPL
jgi:hypothetical protein